MQFKQVLKDIRAIKIQGAENIAVASVLAIRRLLKEGKRHPDLLSAKKMLLLTRPTEPCMQNTLNFIFSDINKKNFKEDISRNIDFVLAHFRDSKKKIADFGSQKITDGDVVFTHCHSSAVISILKTAKQQGASFKVFCTETRPLFQGRLTAEELSRAGIPTTLFVDSAARYALKTADFMILGADAITSDGKVINKVGSELFAEMAFLLDKSVYVATNSWKFDPKSVYGVDMELEKRLESEVWRNHPKRVNISNLAFERVHPRLITAVISELGVLMPSSFVEEVKLHYPWLDLL